MSEQELEKLKFPIGRFEIPGSLSADQIQNFIDDIELFPIRLEREVIALTAAQLDTPYRPDGWTIRQVVHHCADSHMNSLTRFKLALTEEKPAIKPYWEDRWAELPDSKRQPIEPAIQMLKGLHSRWTFLLRSLSSKDLKKSFIHPEHGKEISLEENIANYAWHCNHHLAHITTLKVKAGWH